MEFMLACQTALKYFEKVDNDTGLYSIRDVGDRWVFSGGSKKPTVFYGKQAIAIKKDGEGILPFHLFDERNWELLDHAKDIEVPEEFRIKQRSVLRGDQMTREEKKRRKQKEKEAYKAYLDRISMPTAPRKLTSEEIEQLKKEGRI